MSTDAVKAAADRSGKWFFAFIFGGIVGVLSGIVYLFGNRLSFWDILILLAKALGIWSLIGLAVGISLGFYLRSQGRGCPIYNSRVGGGR